MQENLETYIRDFAKLKGMTVRKVPWVQAQRAKARGRCGHTHHEAHFQPRPNLIIKVAGAKEGNPKVAEAFDFSTDILPPGLSR